MICPGRTRRDARDAPRAMRRPGGGAAGGSTRQHAAEADAAAAEIALRSRSGRVQPDDGQARRDSRSYARTWCFSRHMLCAFSV